MLCPTPPHRVLTPESRGVGWYQQLLFPSCLVPTFVPFVLKTPQECRLVILASFERPSDVQFPPMEVQIFGIKKSPDTRKALRFFAERRVKTHFVDLQERAASPGELKRFAQKFGVDALVDRQSRRFSDLGLAAARFTEERWLEKLVDEPLMLRMPLVRQGSQLTVGDAAAIWLTWSGR